jgi:D-arabinose 1-dehydrogenase-like Zn-dependent alcohol dehydrogenase
VLVGLHGGELTHPLPPLAQRAIGIVGSYVGNLAELKAVVALAKKRKLKPMPVETRPAGEANRALEDLLAGRVIGRVVLDFENLAA